MCYKFIAKKYLTKEKNHAYDRQNALRKEEEMEKNVKQALGNIKNKVLLRSVAEKFRAHEKWNGVSADIATPKSLETLAQQHYAEKSAAKTASVAKEQTTR